ncbi:MAG: CRISPR-associated RAMP protein Csx10 [Leptolyngbyaceae cyanobacterium SL_7_1]|nr:CRISPR-associated RAMP protein Csx10 [Leptolyngbyaceae cyanobacterium SL_7_1]
MKQIILTITAQAPLAIGQQKPGGSVSEAFDYIPGSVIRGAIAAKILQQAQEAGQIDTTNDNFNQPGDNFQALFLDQQAAVFQNAYPAIAKTSDDHYAVICKISLLPATALSSKTNSGFKPKNAGVFDSLIDSFCAKEHGHFYEPNDLTGDRVEPFKGFYSEQENTYRSHSISKRLLTRVGINRRRATAEEQILYSIEVLNETQGKKEPQPSVYRSAIVVDDDGLADQLCDFITHRREEFRLGGSASRGLGKVHLAVELQNTTGDQEIQSRVSAFNTKLKKHWEQWNIFNSKPFPDRHFFTLDLQSDAILTEDWQRTMVISKKMLRDYAGIEDDTLELELSYSSYDYRSGWNAAWGLQKDVELITNMASVYLFSTEQPDRWYEPLHRLEQRGVGDRTPEGFGQVKVCDPFHLIFRENAV